jgi:hypothetical protein
MKQEPDLAGDAKNIEKCGIMYARGVREQVKNSERRLGA